ncbi:MAG: hypothetical protein ABSG21_14155 [Spirochaetia bacterium]|jgi:hypothetical protein
MRRGSPVVAFLPLLVLLSCEQKSAHTGPEATVADSKSAIVIVADLPLLTLSQGALSFKETLPIGEKLALTGQAQKATQYGKERDFLNVRRESGSEGWVRADFVVSRSILAVIPKDDAVIYSAPANTAATTESIPRMTIVAIHSDTGGMSFIMVTFFDAAAKVLRRNVYLRNEGVSARPSDVQAAILLQLAAGSKSPKQQKAFLTSAIKDYPESVFALDLQSALDALTSPAPAPAPTSAPAPGPASAPEPAPESQSTPAASVPSQ